jgi:predicted DNA binding protein
MIWISGFAMSRPTNTKKTDAPQTEKTEKADIWGFVEKPRFWIVHTIYNDGTQKWFVYSRDQYSSLGASIESLHDSEGRAREEMQRLIDRQQVSREVIATAE